VIENARIGGDGAIAAPAAIPAQWPNNCGRIAKEFLQPQAKRP